MRAERAADVEVFLNDPALLAPVQRLPEVAESAIAQVLVPVATDFAPVVLVDGRLGGKLNRFKILDGRALRTDRENEVVVSFLVARRRHLRVGSELTIRFLAPEPSGSQGAPPPQGSTSPATQAVGFRVVGIEASPGEFPPRSASFNLPVYLSPAFLRTPVGASTQKAQGSVPELVVRLPHGARDVPAFLAEVQRLSGGPVGSTVLADQAANVQRSLHLQALAVWLMAAFAAAAIASILFQLLVRQSAEAAADHAALRALGMTSGQLLASGMVRVAVMGVAGTAGAAIFAAVLSPLLPFGTARIAEPHPGFAIDVAALGIGILGVLLLNTLLGGAALLRASRGTGSASTWMAGSDHLSPMGNVMGRAGMPLVVTTGVRLALQPGRGRHAVPVRATVTATAVGVGALTIALTFGASLTHLLATPRLYGVAFDADIQSGDDSTGASSFAGVLRSDKAVAALALVTTGIPLRAGKVSFGALATTSVKGSLDPTLIEGRLPAGPYEIVLGSRTLRDLHAHIGQKIEVSVSGLTRPVRMRITGRGVLAAATDNEQLGQGAVITPDAMSTFAGLAPPGFSVPPPGELYVRFEPGVVKEQQIAALSDKLGGPGAAFVYRPTVPTDVANFAQVRNLPQILAGLLGAIAAAAMAHLLISAVRRRRGELAVLKTLGFVPRQVSAAIAWQATTVAVLALVAGLPLGVVGGRLAWSAVAAQVGVVVQPSVPWRAVFLLVPAVLFVANLVAAGPALVAGRIRPATVLRSE